MHILDHMRTHPPTSNKPPLTPYHARDFPLFIPNSSLRTRLEPDAFRIGTAPRHGAPGYEWRDMVVWYGCLALICKDSVGRYAWFIEVTDAIPRGLASTVCPGEENPNSSGLMEVVNDLTE